MEKPLDNNTCSDFRFTRHDCTFSTLSKPSSSPELSYSPTQPLLSALERQARNEKRKIRTQSRASSLDRREIFKKYISPSNQHDPAVQLYQVTKLPNLFNAKTILQLFFLLVNLLYNSLCQSVRVLR